MTEDDMWQAAAQRDRAFDGKFVYGVKTTGVYCRASCPAKLPKRENVVFFATCREAEQAGFRPCKRCRPDLLDYNPSADLARRAKELIEKNVSDLKQIGEGLKKLGVTRKHLAEVFRTQYGITPSDCIRKARVARAKKLLQDGMSIVDTAAELGCGLSGFYSHFKRETGMTPARFRELYGGGICRDLMDTPIGKLCIMASSKAILCVDRLREQEGASGELLQGEKRQQNGEAWRLVKKCEAELEEYFAGKRKSFDLPLAPEGTDFQKKVWQKLRTVPYGETRSYGELAAMAGVPKGARAAGMASHFNPILILIPCHRIIGADGSLTGFGAGIENKRILLSLEKKYASGEADPQETH